MQAKPKFTRQHYQILADVLRSEYQHTECPSKRIGGVYSVACALADRLAQDNPRFAATHFLSVVRGERAVNSRPTRGVQ